jgi:hypothetical protein
MSTDLPILLWTKLEKHIIQNQPILTWQWFNNWKGTSGFINVLAGNTALTSSDNDYASVKASKKED